jgi:hypothetical protein
VERESSFCAERVQKASVLEPCEKGGDWVTCRISFSSIRCNQGSIKVVTKCDTTCQGVKCILHLKKGMAVIQINSVAQGFSGSLGRIVFRQLRGKTIMAGKPDKVTKQSALQRENRVRFKLASAWAKGQMHDPEKKAYYWRKAKKLKLPNAYTAAVSDYMRKGEIKEIDTRQYKGNAGDVIKMKVRKKDFAVHKVEVTLYDAEGVVVESGMAVKKDQNIFLYKATETVMEKIAVRVNVIIRDHNSNMIMREVYLN